MRTFEEWQELNRRARRGEIPCTPCGSFDGVRVTRRPDDPRDIAVALCRSCDPQRNLTPGTVTPLRRCRRCGANAKPVVLDLHGVTVSVDACDGCVDRAREDLGRVRPVFDAMLAAGVPRGVANETMTFMLSRMDEEAKPR